MTRREQSARRREKTAIELLAPAGATAWMKTRIKGKEGDETDTLYALVTGNQSDRLKVPDDECLNRATLTVTYGPLGGQHFLRCHIAGSIPMEEVSVGRAIFSLARLMSSLSVFGQMKRERVDERRA